ncbi:MAG: hypothetical protein GTN64_05670 [Candidatus Latescibacteria bacterium]|nr:hypothetical protein [Candidatus Latescibacterota bacterium]NIO78098.1 hypothetical protein [Candidatus Latescibacterota bacterium]
MKKFSLVILSIILFANPVQGDKWEDFAERITDKNVINADDPATIEGSWMFMEKVDLMKNNVTDLQDVDSKSGDTNVMATASGTLTSGNCVALDASGNFIAAGAACVASIADLSDVSGVSGNTSTVATASGVLTSGDCVSWDANGNLVADGAPCGSGAGDIEAVGNCSSGACFGSGGSGTELQCIGGNTCTLRTDSTASSDNDRWELYAADTLTQSRTGWVTVSGVNHADAGTTRVRSGGSAPVIVAGGSGAGLEFRSDGSFGCVDTTTPTCVFSLATADASDDGEWHWAAGGSSGVEVGRSGRISGYGNEHATHPGNIHIVIGDVAGAEFEIWDGGTQRWRIPMDGVSEGDWMPTSDNTVGIGAAGTELTHVNVEQEVYGAGWSGSTEVPTKDDVFDKIETLTSGFGQLDYYDHTFTWGSAQSTGSAIQTETITHSFGQPPDKVVVYYQGANGWYEHEPVFQAASTRKFGWQVKNSGTNEDNVVEVDIFEGNESGTARSALVRLLWFTEDDIATATTGLKQATLGGSSITTGTAAGTADILDGSQINLLRLDLGAMPNATTTNDAHGLTFSDIVRISVVIEETATDDYREVNGDTRADIYYEVDGTNVTVTADTGQDFSGYTGKAWIWYLD